ncbi:MAG: NADH-quinone oxidoreductase subunit NuoG, partial [Desulfobacterales bacterium]
VAPGTKVIEAAEQLGIMIPRFCYHPALGSVGACRVCAVKFLQGPFKGVQMSCMVDAQDDMVVSTTDAEAVAFRKSVIEWLMLHHPHDCPVCDAGGQCLLQDMTVSGGHGVRRYPGKKRTYTDQYLGPLVQHEMNRCIHCYRCSRFYQEFSGYRDLGAMQSANQTYFGRFEEGILESPFSGNLIDICPTGVYTDKPSRYFGRRWDYERSPSLCIHCSLGCHTIASSRYRKVVRQEARLSEAINGHFICDRGRYGFLYNSLAQRPRTALVDGQTAAIDEATAALKQRLQAIVDKDGAAAVACAGSSRNSLETLAMVKRVSQSKSWHLPAYFVDGAITRKVQTAVSRLEPDLAVAMRDIEAADFVAVLGADPLNEAPMLALALRQAQRTGATIAVFDPRPVRLPCEFKHLPANPDGIHADLGAVISAALDAAAVDKLGGPARKFYASLATGEQTSAAQQAKIDTLAAKLKTSQRPVIVCGTDTVRRRIPALAADYAALLQATGKAAGLFYLMPGANAFAAGLLADENGSFETLITAIEQGSIKALMLFENNPLWQFPDRRRFDRALQKLELLVVMDYVDSEMVQKADIFLPTTTLYEIGGIYINQEGRAQAVGPAYRGGIPITQTGGGDHPPRVYDSRIPGGEVQTAWQILAQLIDIGKHLNANDLRDNIQQWLVKSESGFETLPGLAQIPPEGLRFSRASNSQKRFERQQPDGGSTDAGRLEVLVAEHTFGTEELSAYSACLQQLAGTPCICMHSTDAQQLNLNDGDPVAAKLNGGAIEARLQVADNMASGILIIPRHPDLGWQKVNTGRTWVHQDQIRKIT